VTRLRRLATERSAIIKKRPGAGGLRRAASRLDLGRSRVSQGDGGTEAELCRCEHLTQQSPPSLSSDDTDKPALLPELAGKGELLASSLCERVFVARGIDPLGVCHFSCAVEAVQPVSWHYSAPGIDPFAIAVFRGGLSLPLWARLSGIGWSRPSPNSRICGLSSDLFCCRGIGSRPAA
jgi:hypothetical protein